MIAEFSWTRVATAPEAWKRLGHSVPVVFAVTLLAATALRYQSFFPSVIDPDESLYLIMAQQWLLGRLPYTAVWDHHSVGLPALFAAIQLLLPNSIEAVRFSATVAVAATATAVYFIVRRMGPRHLPSIASAALYLAWTSRYAGFPANCELYLNALVVPAMALLLTRPRATHDSRLARFCLGALLLGLAWQVKHVVVVETALYCFWVYCSVPKHARLKVVLAVTTSLALPSLIVLGYFCANELGREYFEAMVVSNLSYAGQSPGYAEVVARVPLKSTAVHILILLACVLLHARRGGGERHITLILLWSVASFADIAMPGQYWPHYFLLAFPATCVLVGYLIGVAMTSRWWTARPKLSTLGVLLLAGFACNPVDIYRDNAKVEAMATDDMPRRVAERVAQGLSPGDHVFVFNYQPVIYWLTGARLPTKHVLPVDWSQQFLHATAFDPMRELAAVFSHEPAIVVMTEPDLIGIQGPVLDQFNRALSSYELAFQVQDRRSTTAPVVVRVYRRRPSDMASRSSIGT